MQSQLASSAVSVDINRNQAQAREAQASGEAAYVRLTGGSKLRPGMYADVRLEASRNRETGGFGLGLTIARRIIDGHSGTIALENRAGGGLDVVVRLPVAPPQAG